MSYDNCTAFEASVYLGCYASPAQDTSMLESTSMDLDTPGADNAWKSCNDRCTGFKCMGLSWTNLCKCGNTYGSGGVATGEQSEECGDEGVNCGAGEETCGHLASVYTVVATASCGNTVECLDGTLAFVNAAEIRLVGSSDTYQATCCQPSCATWLQNGGVCANGSTSLILSENAVGEDPGANCCTRPCDVGEVRQSSGSCEQCAAGRRHFLEPPNFEVRAMRGWNLCTSWKRSM